MEIANIQNDLSEELTSNSSKFAIELIDVGIDKILDDSSILDEIPILKSIASACRIGLNIRDRFFAKKVINFLIAFQSGEINTEKYNDFKIKMENEKYRDRVTETIIILLDRLDHVGKCSLLSSLLISSIQVNISWEEFMLFCNIINYLTDEDLETLKLLYENQGKPTNCSSPDLIHLQGSAYKLTQLSLASYDIQVPMFCGTSPGVVFHNINDKGIKLYQAICDK